MSLGDISRFSPTLESADRYATRSILQPDTDDSKILLRSQGIYSKQEMNWYNKFSRIPIIDPYDQAVHTKEYLFFTKPDLHILNTFNGKITTDLSNSSFFVDMAERYKPVIEQLQSSLNEKNYSGTSRYSCPFMTMLTNSVKSTLDLPGLDSESVETGANVYGTRISYRGSSIRSDQDLSFSTEFEDTKFLEVYMLFKMWDEYERLKWLGFVSPATGKDDCERWINYTKNKILHDQISIYKIVVAEDGMTILYFARMTGCYPTGAPRDAFSDMSNTSEGQRITVEWKGQFVRDMDPRILSDFNRIVLGSDNKYDKADYLPLWDTENGMFNGDWASTPIITVDSSRRGYEMVPTYYLKWKK